MQEIDRRWRWNLADKRAAVELSLGPDCNVTAVAACCGVSPAQIYAWRREVRALAEADARQDGPLFVPVVLDAVVEPVREHPRGLPDAMVAVVIEVCGVAVGASPNLVASVVAMLQRMR